jgi:acyl-CoA reductase-like NAD-dependent aldehyde dehydrogenase
MALDRIALSEAQGRAQPAVRGFFCAGKWIAERAAQPVRSPYDQSEIAKVAYATPADLERATAAAVAAFETTRHMAGYERQQILQRTSAAFAQRKEELARTISQEAGKPIKAARAEAERAVFTFQIAAEESTRQYGEWMPLDQLPATRGRWGIVRRFPLGPVAAITPFNFPLNLVAHKVAPAIACGCTMVLKPAPQTPLSALLLAEIIEQAGLPAGALSVLPLSNDDATALVRDERFKLLTFTGSTAVGWMLKQQAGKKRVALELGGNAGVIVHGDADLQFAAERCVAGGFSYQGQSCISVQRVYLQRGSFQSFMKVFVPLVEKLKVGDPADEGTDIGPLIRESDARRVEEWIGEAVMEGAQIVTGGKRHGAVVEPTVLIGTRSTMKVSCMEVFAPLVIVEPYDDFRDAVARVNDSQFGLQAGVFTRDAGLINYAFEELQVGGVMIGETPTFRIDNMPYGGAKDSGMGREGLRYAMEEMTERRLLMMNNGSF